jgi:hypothetical protein
MRCQTHNILVDDIATKEYHSKYQANKLTLVFSTDGGVVLINENPNSTSLQADCFVSQKLCCTNSELMYPAIYHWKQQPKPNPSVIRHTDSVEKAGYYSSGPKWQSNSQTSHVSADKRPSMLRNTHHFGTGHHNDRISQPKPSIITYLSIFHQCWTGSSSQVSSKKFLQADCWLSQSRWHRW